MAHVITDLCKDCKDTACVDICPCDCIAPTADDPRFDEADQLYIDPEHCIDCGLCIEECPPSAIFQDTDLADDKVQYIQINADYFSK